MRTLRAILIATAALTMCVGTAIANPATPAAPGYDGNVTATEAPRYQGPATAWSGRCLSGITTARSAYCTYSQRAVQCFRAPCPAVYEATGIYTYSFTYARWFVLAPDAAVYAWPSTGNGWSWTYTPRLGWTMTRSDSVGVQLVTATAT